MAYTYTPEFKTRVESERQQTLLPEELQRLYDAQTKSEIQSRSELLSVRSNDAKSDIAQADRFLAPFTKPFDPNFGVTPEQFKAREEAAKKPPEKPPEATIELQEAGTTPSGEKLYMLPTGEIKPASQISTEAKRKTQEDEELKQAKAEVKAAQDRLNSLLITDAMVQNQINSINQLWNAKIEQMQDINRRRYKTTQTLALRLGSRWAGGEAGVFGGVLDEEERQGLMRISELEAKKNEAISAAKEAQRKNNWDIYVKQAEAAQKAVEQRDKEIETANKAAADKLKALQDQAKEQREQENADLDNSLKLIKAAGYYAFSALTGNKENDIEMIKAVATGYGTDPGLLYSEVKRIDTERGKYPSGPQGEYDFYRDRALEVGIPADEIPQRFFKFYEQKQQRERAGDVFTTKDILSAQQSLRKEFNALPLVKDFNDIKSKYQVIKSGYDEVLDKGSGDFTSLSPAHQAIIIAFNKMLDPGSVVREGEYARTTQGQSLLNRFYGKTDAYIRGGAGLTSADVKSIVDLVDRIYGDYSKLYNEKAEEYRGYAREYGANPDSVVQLQVPIKTENIITAPDGTKVKIID